MKTRLIKPNPKTNNYDFHLVYSGTDPVIKALAKDAFQEDRPLTIHIRRIVAQHFNMEK